MFKDRILIEESNIAIVSRQLGYIREEKNNFYSINDPVSKYPNYKMLNYSAAIVLSQIDGKNTVRDITKNLMKQYKINLAEYERILEDVKRIMEKFYENGIINWANEINFVEKNVEINDSFVISVAKEDEIKEIKNYLDTVLNCEEYEHDVFTRYISPIVKNQISMKNLVSFTMIRQIIFLYEFTLLIKREINTNEIVGLALFAISKDFPQTLRIDYLFNDNNKGSALDVFDENVLNKIKHMAVENIHKVRLYINAGEKVEELLKNRFNKIAVMESELEHKDLCIYDMRV